VPKLQAQLLIMPIVPFCDHFLRSMSVTVLHAFDIARKDIRLVN
jgi:hypothetical protein